MLYRTPEGEIIRASRTRYIVIERDGEKVKAPSTILDKQSVETLAKYGYRRIFQEEVKDERYYHNEPVFDTSIPGEEHISFNTTPKFSATEARERVEEDYYKLLRPVVEKINRRLAVYEITGQAGKVAEWQAHYDAVRPLFQEAVAEFQRVMGLPNKEQRYEELIALHQNLHQYVYEI